MLEGEVEKREKVIIFNRLVLPSISHTDICTYLAPTQGKSTTRKSHNQSQLRKMSSSFPTSKPFKKTGRGALSLGAIFVFLSNDSLMPKPAKDQSRCTTAC